MRHAKQSPCGSVYHFEDPFLQTQKEQSACHYSSVDAMNSSMASSVHYLQTPLKTTEEERWNGQPLFIAPDEEGMTSARPSENAHAHFDGRMNAENIDPHSEAVAVALSVQSAAGLGRARPGKRKSRVSSKVPIRVFSADADNFMAMVHKLTGFQSSTGLFPDTHQNQLLKPLPYRPLHPVMQGMLTPEFSAYPSLNKMASTLNTDKAPNAWSHSNFASNQSVQVASFHNSSPLANKSLSMQGGYTNVAMSPRIQQLMKEDSRKNESGTDMRIMPHDNVSNVGQRNRKQDQGRGREVWDCEGL